MASTIGLLAAVVVALTTHVGAAHADARMTVRLEPVTAVVPAGDHLNFSAYVECSISPRCDAVAVSISAPSGVSGPGIVSQPLPPDVTTAVARQDGSLLVTYSSIVAGRSSQLSVSWPTINYYTVPGTRSVTMSATAANGDGQPSADTATVSVVAAPNPKITKVGPATATFGEVVTYTIQATNDSPAPNRPRGTLALEDATLTDTLPAGTELVSANPAGYTYDPTAHTLTWPIDTDATRAGSQFAHVSTFPYALRYQVRLRVTTQTAGTTLVNRAAIDCNPFGPDQTPVHVEADATTTVGAGAVGGRFTKYSDVPQAIDGQQVSFVLAATNTGTAAGSVTAVDHVPAGFDPTRVNIYELGSTGAWPGAATVDVGYSGGVNRTLTWAQHPLDVTLAGSEISVITVTVPAVGAGAQLRIQLLGLIDADELTAADVVNNCADFRIEGSGPVVTGQDCAGITVVPALAVAEISKLTDQAPVGTRGRIDWALTVHNDPTGAHSSPLRPQIIDLLPPQLAYVDGSFALSTGQPAACPRADQFDINTVAKAARGRTALRAIAKPGVTIPADDTACEYSFSTLVRAGSSPGNYTGDPAAANYAGNVAALYDADKPLLSPVVDTGDLDSDHDTTEHVALATEDFSVAESSALFIAKEVRGDLDHAFLSAVEGPPLGTSKVGGTVSYRLHIGNLTAKRLINVVAYDLLPAPGTTGVSSDRYGDQVVSEWRPTLSGPIATGGVPLRITYSTKSDPCRPELDNSRLHTASFYCGGRSDFTFVTAARVRNWSAVRSVRFDFGRHVFGPNEVHSLSYTMRVPRTKADGTAFDGGERTWNKVAAQGDRQDTGGAVPLLATEPTWVIDQVFVPGSPAQPEPSPPGPGTPALPVTSSGLQLTVVLAGLASIGLGLGILIVARRRRSF